MELAEWQKTALNHDGDLLMCTGRRVGKSYILARKAVEFVIKKKKQVILVSLTEDQAMLILQFALQVVRTLYPRYLGSGKYKPKLKELTLIVNKKPVKIIVRPVGVMGDSVRGFEGGALGVDEASRMPELFWIAAKPILLTQAGQIWLSSTPNGKQGYFWKRFEESYIKKEANARFKVIYITTEEVVLNRKISTSWTKEQREGAIRILEEDKREMSRMQYGQEYLGLFLEDLNQYFADELIEKCCVLKRDSHRAENIFMGVDIARMGGDEITFEFIKKFSETEYHHVESISKKYQYTTETEQNIHQLNLMWAPRKIGIDAGAGSLGVGILDRLMLIPQTRTKVVAMNNRAISLDREGKKQQKILKEDMYDNLRSMMERGEIKLLDDDLVRASLKSIQYEHLKKTIGMPTQVRIWGSYSHIVEGLIRAAWLAKKESLNKFQIAYV